MRGVIHQGLAGTSPDGVVPVIPPSSVHWQPMPVTKRQRAALKHQHSACLWLNGLSSSGKSTSAGMLEQRLHATGRHTYILDGDNVRHGLNADLGYSVADRIENIRRVAQERA